MTKPVKTTQTEKAARARARSRAQGAGTKPPAAPIAKAAKAGKASPTARRAASSRTAKAVAADAGRKAGRMPGTANPWTGAEPGHDEIAARAYFIHLRRHGAPGNPDEDWLLALSELRRERGLR